MSPSSRFGISNLLPGIFERDVGKIGDGGGDLYYTLLNEGIVRVLFYYKKKLLLGYRFGSFTFTFSYLLSTFRICICSYSKMQVRRI